MSEISIPLGILERLQIHAFLPRQGDYIELTISEDIQKKVNFDQEELELYEMKSEPAGDGTMSWNWSKEKEEAKAIDFTKLELELVQKNIKKADTEKTLTPQQTTLYEKFVKNN